MGKLQLKTFYLPWRNPWVKNNLETLQQMVSTSVASQVSSLEYTCSHRLNFFKRSENTICLGRLLWNYIDILVTVNCWNFFGKCMDILLYLEKKAQAGIKIAGRNINNLRYADDTTLRAESEEELKASWWKWKRRVKKLA